MVRLYEIIGVLVRLPMGLLVIGYWMHFNLHLYHMLCTSTWSLTLQIRPPFLHCPGVSAYVFILGFDALYLILAGY